MKKFYKKIKGERGAALLVVLAVSAILIPLIQGVWLDSQVEYQFKRYRMNELQARYNAKSGISLSLLRIYIFKGVEKSVPKRWKSTVRPLLDRFWFFPFAWPLFSSGELLESEKDEIKNITDQSFLKGAYMTSISPEDGRLDVNELSSPFPYLREFTYITLLNLLSNAVEKKEELKDKYETGDLEEILNNLSDWTDLDNNSQNGGREDQLEEGKEPLNRSFISVEEIKKVPKMTQEIFEILSPHITVYGAKTLNINYSSKEILRALGFPEDLVESIISRTSLSSEYYNPFLNQKAFCDFVDELGLSFCANLEDRWESLDMLRFDFPIAFRIQSGGEYKGQIVNLETLLYDLSAVSLIYQKSRYHEMQRRKIKADSSAQAQKTAQKDKPEAQQPKPPRIDYSDYKSLNIMYLKENF